MNDFRNIWMPLSERFYRAAYYMLESHQDAEDAVQELYLKLWSTRSSMVDVRNPFAYGVSMLKNICIDKVRKRTVRKAEPMETAPQMEAPPLERQMEMKDSLNHLMAEIEKLPPKQRDVLRMKAVEGLEYEEISRRTGLTQVHVRVLVAMARKTLKQKKDI